MTDYVSKEELEEFFKSIEITNTGRTKGEAIHAVYISEVLKAIYNGIMKLPTTDAVSVKHGYWIDIDEQSYTWKIRCSCCDHERSMMSTQGIYPNYCENCGARMDKVEE